MPSRRHIREAVVQFLYSADLEGGADPAELRGPFWDFVTESDRRSLQLATFRTVHHLAHGREGRLAEFVERHLAASTLLSGWPEAEVLKLELKRVAEMESGWSMNFAKLERLPKDDDDASVAETFSAALDKLFRLDRDLGHARAGRTGRGRQRFKCKSEIRCRLKSSVRLLFQTPTNDTLKRGTDVRF